MPFIYILKCADDTFYTGWTTELERRVEAHNCGKGARYTRARRPVVLVYARYVDDKREALREENRIKQLSRHEKNQMVLAYQESRLGD